MTAHEPFGQADVPVARSSKDAVVPYLQMVVAAFLMLLSVVAAGVAIWNLHDRVEKETRAGLGRVALVIADQTSRSFQSVDLVLRGVIDRVASVSAGEVLTGQDLTGKALHEYMAGEVANLPQVANLILINADGDYSNSSQVWPVPAMSLATASNSSTSAKMRVAACSSASRSGTRLTAPGRFIWRAASPTRTVGFSAWRRRRYG